MEDFKKKNNADASDKDIVYSQSVKAGKRIYYIDVKKNRKDEMFLAITESKKIVSGEGDNQQVSFEKHKIFLHQEDFDKFLHSLNESIRFIQQAQDSDNSTPAPQESKTEENAQQASEETPLLNQGINIDIDF